MTTPVGAVAGRQLLATRDGRTFPVRPGGRDDWQEVDERGRSVGPALRRVDLERLVRVSTRGLLDGCDVEVAPRGDGDVAVRGLPLPTGVVERHGLAGSPRDGWTGVVPASAVTSVRELRCELGGTSGTRTQPPRGGLLAREPAADWAPVRRLRRGVWQRWEPEGHAVRLVGPELRAPDLDAVAHVRTRGTVAGHRFTLVPGPPEQPDRVGVVDELVPDDVVQALGLVGNPYDGWRGVVAWSDVAEVVETWSFRDLD